MKVDKNRCPQNHTCPAISVCPVNAITQRAYELPVIDEKLCIHCEKCVDFCPMGAFFE